MTDTETPRLQVVIDRDDQGKWRWQVKGYRCTAGPWVRIESCVANMEEVLGVKAEWVKFRQGQRRLVIIGRPVDATIVR